VRFFTGLIALALCFYKHSIRRTAGTIAPDMGLTLTQMKQITGHKIDQVVEVY
jgi:hypothetical protein